MHAQPPDTSRYPYPTARSGGLFLMLAGLTTVVATLLGGAAPLQPIVFSIGFALSIVIGLVLLRRRLSYGEQPRTQRRAVVAALFLEGGMTPHGGE